MAILALIYTRHSKNHHKVCTRTPLDNQVGTPTRLKTASLKAKIKIIEVTKVLGLTKYSNNKNSTMREFHLLLTSWWIGRKWKKRTPGHLRNDQPHQNKLMHTAIRRGTNPCRRYRMRLSRINTK